jgi:saccharopine dehydrogenase-like NADP-dependent oxidoreductase
VLVNCSPYVFNLKVMEAALQGGCHYLDLGGLFHVTRKQLELNERFKQKNLLAVLGMGAAPGMTNVMAACAADEMDTVDAIDIYAASIDLIACNHPFLPPYALDTILDEYFLSPYVFENGEFKEVPPMSGEHVHDFPQPLGRASSFLTLHSEVATLPLSYKDKGVQRVTYRLGLPALFHERCKFLVDLGFGATNPIKIDGVEIKPRKILAAMIDQHKVPEADPDDCEVIRVDVSGTKGGRQMLSRLETTVMAHKTWKISCGALDTGVPPSIVAQMICRGDIQERGVCAPETCVPAQKFFVELAKRGMEMRKITDEVLASAGDQALKAVSV